MNHNLITFHDLKFEKKVRIDKILTQFLKNKSISRSRVQKLLEKGEVEVDNVPVFDPGQSFLSIKTLVIRIPEAAPTTIRPKDTKSFDIVYEDDDLIVVYKPVGITTHPGAGNFDDTLVNELVNYCGENLSGIGGVMRPGIVHRLDKDTSGLLIVAKNDLSHQNLSEQLQSRSLSRKYYALVYGSTPFSKGTIHTQIARDKIHRKKMKVVTNGGKEAITHYELIKKLGENFSLLSLKLQTGRTHQIRVHLSHIGNSIVGDQTYGGRNKIKYLKNLNEEQKEIVLGFKRQALHAYHIGFVHPRTKEFKEFSIDLPEDMARLINVLEL